MKTDLPVVTCGLGFFVGLAGRKVSPLRLAEGDQLLGNGVVCIRKKITVSVPTHTRLAGASVSV